MVLYSRILAALRRRVREEREVRLRELRGEAARAGSTEGQARVSLRVNVHRAARPEEGRWGHKIGKDL